MRLKVILRIRIKRPYYSEAIAVGMILESYISYDKKLITETEYLEIKTTIKAIDDIVFAENDIDPILELLIHDKKMNTALFNLP
jgi:3-dehydroquinate synthase